MVKIRTFSPAFSIDGLHIWGLVLFFLWNFKENKAPAISYDTAIGHPFGASKVRHSSFPTAQPLPATGNDPLKAFPPPAGPHAAPQEAT